MTGHDDAFQGVIREKLDCCVRYPSARHSSVRTHTAAAENEWQQLSLKHTLKHVAAQQQCITDGARSLDDVEPKTSVKSSYSFLSQNLAYAIDRVSI